MGTNSTAERETERNPEDGGALWRAVVAFVAALAASTGCYSLVPSGTLPESLAQGAVLAAIALVGVGASHPDALRVATRARSGRVVRWGRAVHVGRSGRWDGASASEASRGSGSPGAWEVPEAREAPGALDALGARRSGASQAPGTLDARRSGASGASETQEPDARVTPAAREVPTASRPLGGWGAWTAYVLAVAAAAGVASVVVLVQGAGAALDPTSNALGASADSAGASGAPADALGAAWTLALVALLCLFTGVFEEGVFRVLALDALSAACGDGPRGKARAAFASAALFGLLHVSIGDVSSVSDAASGAQAFLKPVQAGLFGLFMAALYDRTRSLWPLAGIHAAFNLLSVGPALLAGDVRQTYVTGSLPDLALLAATTVLLIPVAVAAVASIVGAAGGRGVTGGRG